MLIPADNIAHPPVITYLKHYTPPTYLIDEIQLNFELNEDTTIVQATLIIRRRPAQPPQPLCLNGEALTLVAIVLNGALLSKQHYQVTPSTLIIHEVPEHFTLEITTAIKPQENTALLGLYRSGDMFCTQCEAQGFRRMTYFLDRPDVLTRFTTTISANQARYPTLLSNGHLIAQGKLSNGHHWATWHDPISKPCYLFALVAGHFDSLEDTFTTCSGRVVTLRIYVNKGYQQAATAAMRALKMAMRWDEQRFHREYDLDLYMMVAVRDFNMGAMENKGLNIFNEHCLLTQPSMATDDDFLHMFSVIAHEYCHNWTGNRITCRDWFQLSLKEGLTIFREQLFAEDCISPLSRLQAVHYLREVQFPEDNGPLAHAVYPSAYIDIDNFYTATIYYKGAEILRMLHTLLGEDGFQAGIQQYFTRYDGQATTIDDLLNTMAQTCQVDLTQFKLWYTEVGTPTVTVEEDYDPHQHCYTLSIRQHLKHDGPPLVIPIRISLFDPHTAIPLPLATLPDAPSPCPTEQVLLLTTKMQLVQFYQLPVKPIPSLLRHFSAPIKLNIAYTDDTLRFLIEHDTDLFNRCDMMQRYLLAIHQHLIAEHRQNKPLTLPTQLPILWQQLFKQLGQNPELLSLLFTPLSEYYLGEQMERIDVDTLHQAASFLQTQLASALEGLLLQQYQRYHATDYTTEFTMPAIGQRRLKNLCLTYLMRLQQPQYQQLCWQQFQAALPVNLTDTLAALSALVNSPVTTDKDQALASFYTTWQHDPMVIDKWFTIQALGQGEDTLQQVKRLVAHPAFDYHNPNRVSALLIPFSQKNLVHFHAKDGEGYAFLREMVLTIDNINPQLAATLVKPLTRWHRYDHDTQASMQLHLQAILQYNGLSKTLYELVSKSVKT